ncbi:MAG TPA: TRAP transporter substrate-binding protein DctP [Deltaproteobacteria bacterium]|nr:TRAP transporter substrate-binding protein DctP [Deltaproteobacteria bacterium]
MFKGKRCNESVSAVAVILLFLIFITIFGFNASSVAAADPKPVELKWAVFVNRELHSMPPLIQWAKDIEAKTNGAVKIKMYFAGEIAQTKDLVHLCRTGSIDVVSTPPVYYTGLFPLNGVLQTYYPLNKTVEQALYSWRGLFRDIPEIQGEFKRHNMYLINRSCLGTYKFVSKKPVRNLADLKGMKMRIIGGAYPSRMVEAADAVAVFQAMQDVYEGFMRGVTDGVLLDVPAIATYRLTEIGKYVGFPWGSVLGWSNSINLDVWNKLSPESRKVIQQTTVEWGANDFQNMLANEMKYTNKLKKEGVEFLDFDKKDYQTIVERAGDPYEHCMKFLIGAKVDAKVAERFITRWRELNEEYEKNYLIPGKKWQYQ